MSHLPPHLLHHAVPVQVLDHGSVQLIDVLGDDIRVAQAARVSFAADGVTRLPSDERDLLRYLFEHRHTSPFEQCVMVIRVRAPLFVVAQLKTHRTLRSNQESGRYVVLADDFYTPTEWRAQSADNKQGSAGPIGGWDEMPDAFAPVVRSASEVFDAPSDYFNRRLAVLQAMTREVYAEMVAAGVAKELARTVLPVSTYTTLVMQLDLHNALHFLGLRTAPDAQAETRAYACAIADLVRAWCPWSYDAWCDYQRDAVTLNRMEIAALPAMMATGEPPSDWKKRARLAFAAKVAKLGLNRSAGPKTAGRPAE